MKKYTGIIIETKNSKVKRKRKIVRKRFERHNILSEKKEKKKRSRGIIKRRKLINRRDKR